LNANRTSQEVSILDYGYYTQKGHRPDDPHKQNQDSVIIAPDFFSEKKGYLQGNASFFGICDGHGKDGKIISQFVVNTIPEVFKRIKATGKDFYQAMNQTIEEVEEQLFETRGFDCDYSGTT